MADTDALEILPIGQSDFEAWQPLWDGYLTFYKAVLPAEVTRVTWARFHDPREPVWAALAWRDGVAIGMVHWIFHRSTWSLGDYCYLQDLFVAPGTRGDGIGRRLIAHVEQAARTAECSRLYWLTHETNTQAMGLYDQVADRSGFLQYRKIL